jgi:Transposase and inactivated derivatives
MVVLAKLLKHREGTNKRELTFQKLSFAFGHKDRQWSHNYYKEFEACGGDMLSFLRRENKLEESASQLIEQQILKTPLLPLPEHYAIFRDTYPEICLSKATFRKYVSRIDSSKVLARVRELLATGDVEPDSRAYIKELLETLEIGANQKKEIQSLFPEAEEVKAESSEALDFGLPKAQKYLIVAFLYACGVSLEILGLLCGVSKGSVHNRIYKLCTVGLENEIISGIKYWSGRISVDEKWVKIRGVWYYVLCAVDVVSGFPLLMRLHGSIDRLSWEVFFREFKALYGTPKLIQSDGSRSLAVAKEKVFPGVRHQLCKFHKLRNLVRVIYGRVGVGDRSLLKRCVRLARHIFSNQYVSSRKSAARRLQELGGEEVSEYVGEHILRCWRKLSGSLTINVSERFNRKIEKSVAVRYGIKSEESARVILRALWLKELLVYGRKHLAKTHPMNGVELSRICQNQVNFKKILHFF